MPYDFLQQQTLEGIIDNIRSIYYALEWLSQTMLSTLLSPETCKTLKDLSNSAQVNVRFICTFFGLTPF